MTEKLIMFCILKKKKYILLILQKINREKQVILLIISNEEGWHNIAVKKLSALIRGIMSTHHSDFYCLNCLHSFATENKRESRKKVCENKDFCNVVMPSEETKILEFNQYKKFDKAPDLL